jgi:hypothetical protein
MGAEAPTHESYQLLTGQPKATTLSSNREQQGSHVATDAGVEALRLLFIKKEGKSYPVPTLL